MLGNLKRENKKFVSVQEAMELAKRIGVDSSDLDYVHAVKDALDGSKKGTKREYDPFYLYTFPLLLLYEIGRVQGIREERESRRAKRQNTVTLTDTEREIVSAWRQMTELEQDVVLSALHGRQDPQPSPADIVDAVRVIMDSITAP